MCWCRLGRVVPLPDYGLLVGFTVCYAIEQRSSANFRQDFLKSALLSSAPTLDALSSLLNVVGIDHPLEAIGINHCCLLFLVLLLRFVYKHTIRTQFNQLRRFLLLLLLVIDQNRAIHFHSKPFFFLLGACSFFLRFSGTPHSHGSTLHATLDGHHFIGSGLFPEMLNYHFYARPCLSLGHMWVALAGFIYLLLAPKINRAQRLPAAHEPAGIFRFLASTTHLQHLIFHPN